MKLKRMLTGALLCAGLVVWSSAGAERLQISQVADRSSELAVFLAGNEGAAAEQVSAALGSVPLKAKSLVAWSRDDGVALVVALDVSASLSLEDFKRLRQQLVHVLGTLPQRSQVALVAVGSEPRIQQPFKTVGPWVGTALEQLTNVAAETALYQSVLLAQELAAQPQADLPLRRAVLVLSDALDDSRRGFSREETLRKVSQGAVPVYALALASAKAGTTQREAIKVLAQIARASGGSLVQAGAGAGDSGEAIGALMAQALQAQLLTLDCSKCPRDGSPRSLQVTLRLPGDSLSDIRDILLLGGPGGTDPERGGVDFRIEIKIGFGITLLVLASLGLWWRKRRSPAPEKVVVAMPTKIWKPDSAPELKPDLKPEPKLEPKLEPRKLDVVQGGLAVVLDVGGRGKRKLNVVRDVVLGRAPEADLRIAEDPETSAQHAALYTQDGKLMLRDLKSSNGTFLNGVKIQRPEPVQDRDLLLVGRTEVRVYLEGA